MRRASIAAALVFGCASPGDAPGPDANHVTMPDVPAAADAAVDSPSSQLATCFPATPGKPRPDYEQFAPIVDSSCSGTNYQDVTGVERVVFLGDSITTGTPPTLPTEFYRTRLANAMRAKFGAAIDVQDCSSWGAHNSDLMETSEDQIHHCFGEVETRKTLVVMTTGGNDMSSIAKEASDGDTPAQTTVKVDASLLSLETAIAWLKDPAHFPNGSYVVFTNIYEFTDATGDLASCSAAQLAGFATTAAPQMEGAYLHVAEQYLRIARDHAVDLVFALEGFCGHGFHSDDPTSPCYRGPDTPRWFDFTCVHPNPAGHAALADLFGATIAE